MFLPGQDGYDEERGGFQTAYQHRPAVIVGALDAEDVRTAVKLAATGRLPVAVQATGHGLAVAAEDGVLISTRRMTGVRIDAEARTAWFEAGVRWEQVIEAAARHGLAPLNGSAPHVGAVSYTLGGGIGLLAREFGYAADHVHSIEVVTADARLRHVTAEQDPDLFWALRGGRDNFGVVTGMVVDLVPVTRVYGGGLYFDGDLVEDVLRAWRNWTDTAPEELTSSIALIPFPDLPMFPEPLRGRYVAHIRVAYTGADEEGERLVGPLREIGPRLMDTVADMPYTESGTIHNDPTMPHEYHGSNVMLGELDGSAVPAILELTGPGAPELCIVQLNHLGGALSRPPAVANAVGHRDARYLLGVLSPVRAAEFGAARSLHRRLSEALAPQVTGRSLNFMFGEDAELVRGAFDEGDYRRLTELKAAYDPANLFRLNHNIPPKSA